MTIEPDNQRRTMTRLPLTPGPTLMKNTLTPPYRPAGSKVIHCLGLHRFAGQRHGHLRRRVPSHLRVRNLSIYVGGCPVGTMQGGTKADAKVSQPQPIVRNVLFSEC